MSPNDVCLLSLLLSSRDKLCLLHIYLWLHGVDSAGRLMPIHDLLAFAFIGAGTATTSTMNYKYTQVGATCESNESVPIPFAFL